VIHYFLDTSAFTKLYSLEPGSKRVKDMLRSASVAATSNRVLVSELAHPETVSALSQIVHGPNPAGRGLSRFSGRQAFLQIAQDLRPPTTVVVIKVTGLMPLAADLVWKYRITGADAVHLAAALKSRDKLSGWSEFHFVSSDRRLNAAASSEGLDVLDPTV
jgi:predicted nucleic acid-binding protein